MTVSPLAAALSWRSVRTCALAFCALTLASTPGRAAVCGPTAHLGNAFAEYTSDRTVLTYTGQPYGPAPQHWNGAAACPHETLVVDLQIDHAAATSSGTITLYGAPAANIPVDHTWPYGDTGPVLAQYDVAAYDAGRSRVSDLFGGATRLTIIGLSEPRQTHGAPLQIFPGGARLFLGMGGSFGDDFFYPRDYPEPWEIAPSFNGDSGYNWNSPTREPYWSVYWSVGMVPVPLPPGLALLGAAIAGLAAHARLRRRPTPA